MRLEEEWLPPNAVLSSCPLLCLSALEQRVLVREVQRLTPVDNLAVGVVGILSTEGRPTD